ncbi:hypothetical protein MTO96_028799 [Rhipicephalus appendiculatus]
MPHATTGEAPAMLLVGRRLRTRLDLVRPSIEEHVARRQFQQPRHRGSRSGVVLSQSDELIVCPFHEVTFNDLLEFLDTAFRIYILTMHETSETCPYYVRDFLNHTFYEFNLTTEERCEPNTTRYSADLGNDTRENTPYMDILNWNENADKPSMNCMSGQ